MSAELHSRVRTWRFWCDGCTDTTIRSLAFNEERPVAVEWVKAHDGHGLGGFVTPFEGLVWCDDCNAHHHPDQYRGEQ